MKKLKSMPAIAFVVFTLCFLVFAAIVFASGLIPKRMALLICAVLVLLGLFLFRFIFQTKSRSLPKVCGWIAGTLGVVLVIASVYFGLAVQTMKNITQETKIEVSVVNVYMLAEETNEQTELSADMLYGILEVKDRENTDHTVRMLEQELNATLRTKNYEDSFALVDGLIKHEVDAIILNSAFLDLLRDMDDYQNVDQQLRIVKNTRVEREVVVKNNPSSASNRPGIGPSVVTSEDGLPSILTMYISGIDSRDGLIDKSRSDVNIIAVINFNTHQVFLLTTPRDYYVPLSISNGIKDKLTHAGIYGVNVSMETLEMLYDIKFDYYFRVNFDGFIDIIEALGGVTVYIDKDQETTEYTFPAGENELNGYKALSFVRNRFGIGDRQRGYNQMAMIKGVINKLVSTDALKNFSSILKAVEGSFETSMPYDVLSQIVSRQLETNPSWEVVAYAVNGEGASRTTYSMNQYLFVFLPIQETVDTAKEQLTKIYNNEILEQLSY